MADSKLVGPPLRELSASAHGLRALTEAGEVLAVDGGAPQAAPDVTDKSDYLLPRLATLEEASP